MYHAIIERQILKLSNDIRKIKLAKRVLLKNGREFK